MKTVKDESDFYNFSEIFPVKRLKDKMLDVCNEESAYVADELLLLSEEILSQVAAYGVCLYLQHGENLQTEKNNDYILHELFLNRLHQNAGPVFFKVRNIVNEVKTKIPENEFNLFNSDSEINKELQELAAFRNALMHGFFKLPALRNLEIIKDIQKLLKDLIENYNIFKHAAAYHFWNQEGFTGHFAIQDDNSWDNLSGNVTLFEKLAGRANIELHSVDLVHPFVDNFETATELEEKGKLEGFIAQDNANNCGNSNEIDKAKKKPSTFKESLYVQFHPWDKKRQDEFYNSAYSFLSQKKDIELLSYTIDENGIGYTSYLLFCKIIDKLIPVKASLKEKFTDKKKLQDKKFLSADNPQGNPKDKAESLIKDIGKLDVDKNLKIVILINNIHLVPFASNHITSLMKFFKESGIYFIGIGWEYEHLNSNFSQKLELRKDRNEIPEEKEIQQLIKNHTRHRGPYEGEDDFKNLNGVIQFIYEKLKNNQPVIARQLADEEKVDIELINEALYILYPYLKYDQNGEDNIYIKDELDELYEFPKNQTETSSIFLTLGRRDIDLEYKHKILKP